MACTNEASVPPSAVSTAVPAVAESPYNRLDETDLVEARTLGLLLDHLPVSSDAMAADFGIAYEKKGGNKATGCAGEMFCSQKALQERCKQFAMQRGFQLFVSGSSTRANNGGNVKYRCKKLHGQQFFDQTTPINQLQCPFYINGYGKNAQWKVTRACYLHNHYKFIGWRVVAAPLPATIPEPSTTTSLSTASLVSPNVTETKHVSTTTLKLALPIDATESCAQRLKSQRNTTMSMKALCRIVSNDVSIDPIASTLPYLDGKAIRRILLRQGHTINHMMASRIKRHLHDEHLAKVRLSFQYLSSYLHLVAEKNPGSFYRVETRACDGVFTRALFIPYATLQAVPYCRPIVSLDRLSPSESGKRDTLEHDDTRCGVFLKAAVKDWNDDVIVFAIALVAEEHQANWEWFLTALQNTLIVDWNQYTVFAGRTCGLERALYCVWPLASHHFCMRRLIEEDLERIQNVRMTQATKQHIVDMAQCASEAEFDVLRHALGTIDDALVSSLDEFERSHWVKYAFWAKFRRSTFHEVTADFSVKGFERDALLPQHATVAYRTYFGTNHFKSSHPLEAFYCYLRNVAQVLPQRREAVITRRSHELVPRRDAQLQENLQASQRCEVRRWIASIPWLHLKSVFLVVLFSPFRVPMASIWFAT